MLRPHPYQLIAMSQNESGNLNKQQAKRLTIVWKPLLPWVRNWFVKQKKSALLISTWQLRSIFYDFIGILYSSSLVLLPVFDCLKCKEWCGPIKHEAFSYTVCTTKRLHVHSNCGCHHIIIVIILNPDSCDHWRLSWNVFKKMWWLS